MLLKKLVEIESPTGSEHEIKDFVRDFLESNGYSVVEGQYFISTKSKSELIVSTHLDTTPVKAPFSTDGVYAYGTGVCDAKASVAAILEAAERGVDFTIAFFCDEEEGGKGSKEFAEKWSYGSMAVVMEPTDLKIASRHYGNLDLTVEVKGVQSHGSYPEMGVNAIEKAFEMISELKKHFKVTPLKIAGGSDDYVIPDYCMVKLDVLIEPETKLEEALKEIEFLSNYGKYEVSNAYEGFISKEVAGFLERAMRAAGLEVEHTVMPSWTDALNLKDRYDVVVWGPGELHLCHTVRERVRLADVERARDVLLKLSEMFK
ncbi:M20/M25/M40 family metallo-hydrolase [Archaeoglobus sp.]|uniref:M20/M25/M40 family metallo-hydrolase n=1 Tax=Archaeoglobus sp. TaxID=1872626 RepID=UPI0024AA9DB0|nr:M20/M25/M40 family metallo-hydrolase [Archaeoglobus sp.]MDI3496958.1 acetylornithine deacetylase [Archaeoglobus sp.]